MNNIYKSAGHGLAYALFFDGASTLMLSACDLEKSYVSSGFVRGVNSREDLSKAFYASAKDALYGFSPFALRYFIKADLVSYGVTEQWVEALMTSAFIGAYTYWSRGENAYIGAYNDIAYAFASLLEQDQTFLGAVLTTGVIESIEGLLKSQSTVKDLRKSFVINSLAGAATGALSWVLLDRMGLYNQCLDNIAPAILSSTLCPQLASMLGLVCVGYNLYQIALSRDPFSPLALHLSGLNMLCVSVLATTAAAPMLLTSTVVAVLATLELSKVINLHCGKSCSTQDRAYC